MRMVLPSNWRLCLKAHGYAGSGLLGREKENEKEWTPDGSPINRSLANLAPLGVAVEIHTGPNFLSLS